MKAILLAAILVLPGCAILPDVADLEDVNSLHDSFRSGVMSMDISCTAAEFREVLWRDHIPDGWEQIKTAIMKKV